jgi:Lar family restriction alleviation protein
MTADTAAPSLLPCPFCGKQPVLQPKGKVRRYMIYCANDDCMGPHTTADNKQDALVQWNTRATPPAPTPSAAPQAGKAIALLNRLWSQFYDRRPPGDPKNTYRELKSILALLPDAAAIRAAAFEEAAKIAERDALNDQWPFHGSEMMAPSRRMQITIASAIRDAGRR